MFRLFNVSIILHFVLIFILSSNHVYANNEAYEASKESFNKVTNAFNEVKEKVDSTYEILGRFHNAINTWRNAVSKETQNRGIEEIDKLADDKIEAVIDTLYDKIRDSLNIPEGMEIPQSMKEKAVEKLRERFKGYVPDKIANKLGYMYTLSSLDRKLRDNYIYDNLIYIKKGFDSGAKLLGNFKNAIQFIDTFSPQSAESSPVGRLNKVKDFLTIISDVAKPVPLLSDMIGAYVKATDGFMTALTDLDNKLRNARQGSLCGQRGVDADIQAFFQKNYPGEDCLTYLMLPSSQYPYLSPIRAWEGFERSNVFLWLDGKGAMISANNFQIMYRYYSALKDSYSYAKSVNHESLFYLAMASAKSNLTAIADRFDNYYKRFEKDYYFKEVLEFEALYKNGIFKSLQGTTLSYQLGGSLEEFGGLCFFNSSFRKSVEDIFNKYKDAYVVKGTIKPSPPNTVITKITVLFDNNQPKELRCADSCTFKNISFNEKYTIKVIADGFQDYIKTFEKDRYPSITISAKIQPSSYTLNIIGPTSGEVGNEFVFYADLREQIISDNQRRSTVSYSWSINGRAYGGNENSLKVRLNTIGTYTIVVNAWQWSLNEKKWLKIAEGRHLLDVKNKEKDLYPTPTPTLLPTITPNPTPTYNPTPTPKPTPTPTPQPKSFSELTKEQQKLVLDCLCRCNSTATSSVAVYYEPKPVNASPSCSDPSNGPCVNQGFGCWRHVPQNTGSCAERCYKSANIQSVPDSYMKGK